jgi:hypothetical protein
MTNKNRQLSLPIMILVSLLAILPAAGLRAASDRPAAALSTSPLVIRSTGKCLAVKDGSANNGTPIVEWDCNGSVAQSWYMSLVNDTFEIRSSLTDKCLVVQNASPDNNAAIIQWDCNGSENSYWIRQRTGSYYRFINLLSSRCLDLPAGNPSNGTGMIQWSCNDGDNQSYSFAGFGSQRVFFPLLHGAPPSPCPPSSAPAWKILVLIYSTTDYLYTDASSVQRHFHGELTEAEFERIEAAVTRFVDEDIPQLNNCAMQPTVKIRYPSHALSSLSPMGCSDYAPGPSDVAADRDPAYDSVITVYDGSGTDLLTGQPLSIEACAWAFGMGTGQAYATIFADFIHSDQRNVLKHEWGHSILSYYDAAGTAPKPAVNNHINNTDTRYVNCTTGKPYILIDESDTTPLPNSIYNNQRGFTHDYYSGLTATADQPTRCLGITPSAWASGGPVSRPVGGTHTLQSLWRGPQDDHVTGAVPDFWHGE